MSNTTVNKMFSLEGKVIVVTGASRGIGLEIANALARAGAIVHGVGRSQSPNQEAQEFTYHSVDITNTEKLSIFIEGIAKNDSIDGLVNCAGITQPDNEDMTIQEKVSSFTKTFEVNTLAPYKAIMLVADYMKQNQKGSIVNVTSIGAMTGFPGNPAYVTSKTGLRGLTKGLANDLAQYNIRLNNLVPGYIETDMTSGSFNNPDLKKKRDDRILLNRWGKTDDLVGPTIFMLSDASSYMTGSDVIIDGGWLCKGLSV